MSQELNLKYFCYEMHNGYFHSVSTKQRRDEARHLGTRGSVTGLSHGHGHYVTTAVPLLLAHGVCDAHRPQPDQVESS